MYMYVCMNKMELKIQKFTFQLIQMTESEEECKAKSQPLAFLKTFLFEVGHLFLVINCSSNYFIYKFLQKRSKRTLERIRSLEMERKKRSLTTNMTGVP